jgi:hypothetical protein
MPSWSLAATLCLLLAGGSLLAGQWALAGSHDLVALYWLVTGAVVLRSSLGLAQKRGA